MRLTIMWLLYFFPSVLSAITPYTSQVGQDQFINECFFHNKRNGIFIDIGAHDGISYSNTYFFEKELDWQGICFEPLPSIFPKLQHNRNCICIQSCVTGREGIVDFMAISGEPEMLSGIVASYDPRHQDRIQSELNRYGGSYKIIKIPAVTLNTILLQYHITSVDYLSIDTEGSELEILQSIDFNAVHISAIAIENNYHDEHMRILLKKQGFIHVATLSGFDETYVHKTELDKFHYKNFPNVVCHYHQNLSR